MLICSHWHGRVRLPGSTAFSGMDRSEAVLSGTRAKITRGKSILADG